MLETHAQIYFCILIFVCIVLLQMIWFVRKFIYTIEFNSIHMHGKYHAWQTCLTITKSIGCYLNTKQIFTHINNNKNQRIETYMQKMYKNVYQMKFYFFEKFSILFIIRMCVSMIFHFNWFAKNIIKYIHIYIYTYTIQHMVVCI